MGDKLLKKENELLTPTVTGSSVCIMQQGGVLQGPVWIDANLYKNFSEGDFFFYGRVKEAQSIWQGTCKSHESELSQFKPEHAWAIFILDSLKLCLK